MATYSYRKIDESRHEWLIPVGPHGACWTEVYKAVRAAHQDLWALGLVEKGKDASDDTIRMEFDDENIIVFFVTSKDASGMARLK